MAGVFKILSTVIMHRKCYFLAGYMIIKGDHAFVKHLVMIFTQPQAVITIQRIF